MPRIDQKRYYLHAIKKHGTSAQGVAWRDRNRQQRRFAALLKAMGPMAEHTIVDAGCGFGDLFLFMRAHNRLPARYLGIDALEPMVETAKERTGQTILRRDILKDPLPEAHWYLASGTFNLLTRFETILAIKRCCDAATYGVVFNLLKGRDNSDTYNHWLPHEIAKACESFGKVRLYEGYLEGDFTIKITKG